MKNTKIKISICQDGSLSEGSVSTIDFQFPLIPKKLLKPMGFERVDDTTYVGLNPVFLTLLEKDQEIKIEFSVEASEARKKILALFEKAFKEMEARVGSDSEEKTKPKPKTARKTTTSVKTKKPSTKKTATAKKTKSEPKTKKPRTTRTTRNSTAKKAG